MLRIKEMKIDEIKQLLQRVGYGHLGCVCDNRPYVVPIQYVYNKSNIYIFTTAGMKTEFIEANPQVCLQVEEIRDKQHWQSVIVNGRAMRLESDNDRAFALMFIKETNPARTPALHEQWVGPWTRENVSVIYRIYPDSMTGRKTGDN